MMLLAERAGRKLERRSNSAPRGMAVIALVRKGPRRNKIRPIGLLHFEFFPQRRPADCRPGQGATPAPLSLNTRTGCTIKRHWPAFFGQVSGHYRQVSGYFFFAARELPGVFRRLISLPIWLGCIDNLVGCWHRTRRCQAGARLSSHAGRCGRKSRRTADFHGLSPKNIALIISNRRAWYCCSKTRYFLVTSKLNENILNRNIGAARA